MNKTIVITGASRGIGYQASLHLANKAHTVIAVSRSGNKLKELASSNTNGLIIPVQADITQEKDIHKIKEVADEYKTIDGLLNNAGALHRGSFMDTDLAEWKRILDVNILGIVRMIKCLKPMMNSGSHIVNIASMSGYQGSLKFAGLSAYGASKAAVVGLSEVLAVEFADDGITVNCLCLGAVETEMFAEAFPGLKAPVRSEDMGEYIGGFILEGHQFFNGQVLPVALNNPD